MFLNKTIFPTTFWVLILEILGIFSIPPTYLTESHFCRENGNFRHHHHQSWNNRNFKFDKYILHADEAR